jgi:signal transduction histidine kinase
MIIAGHPGRTYSRSVTARVGPVRPVHLALVAVASLMITLTVSAARLSPGLGDARHGLGVLTVDDLHEGQLEAMAAMVLTLIAAVLWGRVRRVPTRRHLLLFTALCTLALDNLVAAVLTGGFDSLSANRFATWAATLNGLIAVVLLAGAAWLPDERLAAPRRAFVTVLAAVLTLVSTTMLAVWLLRNVLPGAFVTRPEEPGDVTLLSDHPSLYVIEMVTAAAWAVAAVLFAQVARRTLDELTWWLALASVLACASSVNYALFPSHFTELLYLGDYFFLLAVAALLVGSVREIGAAEAALVDRALYLERRRIAREMHDGVAQELAIVSTQTHHIRSHPEALHSGLQRIQESVERAMDDARTAIRHLSGPVDESLAAEISTAALVITEREGARLVLDLDERVAVPRDVRLALVHVTQDAVAAAVRGAAAGEVQVALHQNGATVLSIIDDGAACEPGVRASGSSMTSIRERVDRLAGSLGVTPREGGGLTVEVTVP